MILYRGGRGGHLFSAAVICVAVVDSDRNICSVLDRGICRDFVHTLFVIIVLEDDKVIGRRGGIKLFLFHKIDEIVSWFSLESKGTGTAARIPVRILFQLFQFIGGAFTIIFDRTAHISGKYGVPFVQYRMHLCRIDIGTKNDYIHIVSEIIVRQTFCGTERFQNGGVVYMYGLFMCGTGSIREGDDCAVVSAGQISGEIDYRTQCCGRCCLQAGKLILPKVSS